MYGLLLNALAAEVPAGGADQAARAADEIGQPPPDTRFAEALAAAVSALP